MSTSNAAAAVITGPTGVRHEGHLGFASEGGFEARNLPPHIQAVFNQLNEYLQKLGHSSITQKEAKYLLRLVLKMIDPVTGTIVGLPGMGVPAPPASTPSAEAAPAATAPPPKPKAAKMKVTGFYRSTPARQSVSLLSSGTKEEMEAAGAATTTTDGTETETQPAPEEAAQPVADSVMKSSAARPRVPQISEGDMKRLEEEISNLQSSKKADQQKLQQREEEIQTLQARLNEEQDLVQQLRAQLEEQKREAKEEKKEKKTLQEQIERLIIELQSLRRDHADTQAQTTAIQELEARMQSSANEQLEAERTERAEVEQALAAAKQEITTLTEKIRTLEGEKKKLASDAQRFSEQAEENAARVKHLERQTELFKQELEDLRTQLAEIEEQRDALEAARQAEEEEEEEEAAPASTGAPAPPPPPPSAPKAPVPPPPPVAPSSGGGAGLLTAEALQSSKLKSTPAPAPKKQDDRSALLDAIKGGGVQLKKVDPNEIQAPPKVDDSLLGILAKAVLDRRAALMEEDADPDDAPWD